MAPIRCEDVDLQDVLINFGTKIIGFPITYLGPPITTLRLRLVHLQFVLDHIIAHLGGWKGRLMTMDERRVLVGCVLSILPTFAMTVLRTLKKFLKEIHKPQR